MAFIYYLLPEWSPADGGTLDLFSTGPSGHPDRVVEQLLPENNMLGFFQVSPVSFHQVAEVLSDKTRLSLAGWFHGPTLLRPALAALAPHPTVKFGDIDETVFYSWINPAYLDPGTQAEIGDKFEKSSRQVRGKLDAS